MYCGYTHRTDQGKILKKKTIIGLRETRAAHIFYQLPLAPRTSFAIIFFGNLDAIRVCPPGHT